MIKKIRAQFIVVGRPEIEPFSAMSSTITFYYNMQAAIDNSVKTNVIKQWLDGDTRDKMAPALLAALLMN